MKPGYSLKTNYKIGIDAESFASDYLKNNGFEILALRYKTKAGEIDIVAKSANTLIFVEVKRRKFGVVDDPISALQKKRIINTALQFNAENQKLSELDMRFDVILIDNQFTLTHIEDSWRIEEI